MKKFLKNNWFKILIFLVLILLAFLYILEKNKNTLELAWANEPDQYVVHTYQIGGVGIRQFQSSANYATEHGYLKPIEKYSQVSFNSPADLMWVYCADGYIVTSCSSNDSQISFDPFGNTPMCGLLIDEKQKSSIQYTCTKSKFNPPEGYKLIK